MSLRMNSQLCPEERVVGWKGEGPMLRVGMRKAMEIRMAKLLLHHPPFFPKLGLTLMWIREVSNMSQG